MSIFQYNIHNVIVFTSSVTNDDCHGEPNFSWSIPASARFMFNDPSTSALSLSNVCTSPSLYEQRNGNVIHGNSRCASLVLNSLICNVYSTREQGPNGVVIHRVLNYEFASAACSVVEIRSSTEGWFFRFFVPPGWGIDPSVNVFHVFTALFASDNCSHDNCVRTVQPRQSRAHSS